MKATMHEKRIWDIFFNPGEVVEVRAFFQHNKVYSGYFDDHDAFSKAVSTLDAKKSEGVYFTLQVIDQRLIARAFNRMREGSSNTATSDKNVIAYRWIPIDIDPVRPAGIGSSASELGAAMSVRDRIRLSLMNEYDLPVSLTAMSGNGAHILVRLPDIPVSDESTAMVKGFLEKLDKAFSIPGKVKVDTAVFNPARVWKLYGTTARKGEDIPEGPHREARPYRQSFIDSIGG